MTWEIRDAAVLAGELLARWWPQMSAGVACLAVAEAWWRLRARRWRKRTRQDVADARAYAEGLAENTGTELRREIAGLGELIRACGNRIASCEVERELVAEAIEKGGERLAQLEGSWERGEAALIEQMEGLEHRLKCAPDPNDLSVLAERLDELAKRVADMRVRVSEIEARADLAPHRVGRGIYRVLREQALADMRRALGCEDIP